MGIGVSQTVLLFCILQLLLVSLFLLSNKKGRRMSNLFLGSFFLVLALNFLDSYLIMLKMNMINVIFLITASNFPLLFGPLLYFYTKSNLFKIDFNYKKILLHFMPFFSLCFATLVFLYMQDNNSKRIIIQSINTRQIPKELYYSSILLGTHFCVYAVLSLRLISDYRKMATKKFSIDQRSNINWLSSVLIFIITFMIASMANNFLEFTVLAKYYFFILTILILMLFVFINYLLLSALKTPMIFHYIDKDEFNGTSKKTAPVNLSTTPATTKKVDLLLQFMLTEKPYLNPDITLDDLANGLSYSAKETSSLINEYLHQNFFDFINRYRIEDAKYIMKNSMDKKITILEILYEVGFNSKSSFNRLFKRYTGSTPTEFKKKKGILN
jgi:AraC-like DNA-binding protein